VFVFVEQSSVPLRLSLGRPRFRWTRFGAGKYWSVLSAGEWRFSDASELAGDAGRGSRPSCEPSPQSEGVGEESRGDAQLESRDLGFMVLNGRPLTNMFSFRLGRVLPKGAELDHRHVLRFGTAVEGLELEMPGFFAEKPVTSTLGSGQSKISELIQSSSR
jgi:hypothetical protein